MSKAQKPEKGGSEKNAHIVRISDEAPLAAQDELPVARRLLAMMGVPQEASPEEMLQDVVVDLNRASYYAVRAGARFLAIKASLKHGEFVPAIEALGIEPRRAQDCMRLARFVAAMPEGDVGKLLSAPKSKLLAISRADPEVVDQLVEAGQVSQLDQLSVRELQQHIRKLEGKLAAEQTRRETAEATTDRVKAKALNRLVDSQLPEFCVVAREESAALSEQMSLALDGLELLARDNLFMGHDEVADAERFAAMAAGTFFHGLRAIHARAGHLLHQLAETFPEVTDKVGFEHQLKPGELDAFKHARELVLGRIKVAASNREAERHNAKGGRGRPRDIKKAK